MDDYLGKLGQSEIEFEGVLDSWLLGKKLKKKIEPILVEELVRKPDLSDEQIHKRIEQLVDEYLPDELDEDLEVEEPVEDWR